MRASEATETAGIRICNNSQVLRNGQKRAVPDQLWTTVPPSISMISYSEPWAVGVFVESGSRLQSATDFVYSGRPAATATLAFHGTRARYYGCQGRNYGLVALTVDGGPPMMLDVSVVAFPDVVAEPTVGFCGQMLYDTGILPLEPHTLEVKVVGMPGTQTVSGVPFVPLTGFDYQDGSSSCDSESPLQPTPSP